ncbi:aspartic peptidase domain-containing protein [Flagelloscypha sp. PMI_526]|nr:aspartic peptidase domain-containing protein [Flagelloscypha sp. PMI_526]
MVAFSYGLCFTLGFLYASAFVFPLTQVPWTHPGRLSRDLAQHFLSDTSVLSHSDTAYTVPIKFGAQELSVMLDTGSSDLWVLSTNCSSTDCLSLPKYSPSLSSSYVTLNEAFSLSYLLGSVTGSVGEDTLTLGPYQILQQAFALANATNGLGLASSGMSGILGLAFPLAASITSGQTVLQNIFSALPESNRFFAVKLSKHNAPQNASTSSFTIGSLDHDIANDTSQFHNIPVSRVGGDNYNYWKVPLNSVTVNSTSIPLPTSLVAGSETPLAVLDTGTTLILGPHSAVDAFWSSVGQLGKVVRKNNETGRWEVRCERAIQVSLTLGMESFPLDPAEVNWKPIDMDGSWCLGGIQANDEVESGDWLLGSTFLRVSVVFPHINHRPSLIYSNQNVYVLHYGANSTHEPHIGLLPMINATEALYQFRSLRANDNLPPTTDDLRASLSTPHHPPQPWIIYLLTSISSFFTGAALMTTFSMVNDMFIKRSRKRRRDRQ